jgi:ferredoxin-NADP reductase
VSVFSDVVRRVVVQHRTQVARDVVALELAATNGRPLPAWTPGSHVDLLLPGGIERQYSLCGDPADTATYRVAVLREAAGRGGSAHVHDRLQAGTTVGLRGPRNHFAYEPAGGRRTVFVAGGIGITPMLSMVGAARTAGVPWGLHYAGRSRAAMAFVEPLLAEHPERVSVYPADEGRRLDVDAVLDADPHAQVLCCGPRRLVDAVERAVARHPGATLHEERFEAREVGPPVWPGPFAVELALTGVTVTVPPERSVLEVAEEAGAVVVSSCRAGTCGSCETPVLAGDVEHRDSVIGPGGGGATLMVCVSRAACERLVLEL